MATKPPQIVTLEKGVVNAHALNVVMTGSATTFAIDSEGGQLPSYRMLVDRTGDALDSAERAENAAVAAEAVANIWPDTTTGLANTADGRYFSVPSTVEGEFSILYQRVGSSAVEIARTADSSAVVNLAATIRRGDSPPKDIVNVSDKDGNTRFRVRDEKIEVAGISIDVSSEADALVVRDREGFWRASLPFSVATTNRLDLRDAMNRAQYAEFSRRINTTAQRFSFKYSIVVTYGQSFGAGSEGWPALSAGTYFPIELLMLGNATRPDSLGGTTWQPVGGAAEMKPMIAVTQANSTGNPVMTPTQVAALTPGSDEGGETFEVGALNMWRKQWLQWHSLSTDPSRKVIAVNAAVGGKSVEQLSKGATPNLYNRVISACQAVKDWVSANDPGASVGLVAVFYDQGQNNSTGSGTRDRETFKSLTRQLFADIRNDVAATMFSQSALPTAFIFQTGSSYTQTVNDMSIQMAQVELADEDPTVVLVGPTYGVTNKGNNHRDSNGTRWNGSQLGKVVHRVLDRGEPWQPLRPLKATYSGRVVLIDMFVPAPPLQFRPYYIGSTAVMDPAKGFRAQDDSGAIGVEVDLAADTIVRLRLSRDVVGSLAIYYGDAAPASGCGNLYDSDSTGAADNYVYAAGTGQYPAANIADLVNRPYPLNNACVAFRIAAQLQ